MSFLRLLSGCLMEQCGVSNFAMLWFKPDSCTCFDYSQCKSISTCHGLVILTSSYRFGCVWLDLVFLLACKCWSGTESVHGRKLIDEVETRHNLGISMGFSPVGYWESKRYYGSQEYANVHEGDPRNVMLWVPEFLFSGKNRSSLQWLPGRQSSHRNQQDRIQEVQYRCCRSTHRAS